MDKSEVAKRFPLKNIIAIVLLLAVCVLSMTVLSKAASDPAHHEKTIASLEEKKTAVLEITAVSTAAATAIAAIPGEATTPVADKLADLSSYFLIILIVVFVEKYLVTLTGSAAFFILIPIACLLLIAGILSRRSSVKALAAKIAAFGLIIFMLIPMSIKVSDMIEDTYETSMAATMESARELTDDIDASRDSEGNVLQRAWDKIKGGVKGVINKGEELLSRFIESIAVMMVTSCVIPIVVLLFALWVVKTLFGIHINYPARLPAKKKKEGDADG